MKQWIESEREKLAANLKAKAYDPDSELYFIGQVHLLDTMLDLFEEELK